MFSEFQLKKITDCDILFIYIAQALIVTVFEDYLVFVKLKSLSIIVIKQVVWNLVQLM